MSSHFFQSYMLEEKKTTANLNFELFVEFVIHEIRSGLYSFGTLHWLPQTHICPVCHHDSDGGAAYDFIGHLDTLEDDLEELVRLCPELERFKDLLRGKPNAVDGGKISTASRSHAYFRQLDKRLVLQLFEVYKDDFALFGFPYPEEFVKIARMS